MVKTHPTARKRPAKKPPPSALGATVQESVVKAGWEVAADTGVPGLTTADAGEVTGAILDVLASDAKFVNATSSEAWWQSGVQYGGSAATLASLFIVGAAVRAHGFDLGAYDQVTFIPAVIALAGGVFTLIRRFVPGLRPLFTS